MSIENEQRAQKWLDENEFGAAPQYLVKSLGALLDSVANTSTMKGPARRRIDLWYPGVETERGPTQATEVEVQLMHVRAANCIVVDYDFERDGYRIRMPSVFEWAADDKVCDEKLVEVAFVPAWASGEPPDP